MLDLDRPVAEWGEEEREEFRRLRRQAARAVLMEEGDIQAWAKGLKIRTPLGEEEIDPYPYQRKLWSLGKTTRYLIILKARQVGVTQAMAVEMLARAIRRENTLVLFISARQDTANQALEYVYRLYDSEGGFTRLVERTKDSCKLENRSEIICLPANESAARGYAASHVYLDEFAHMPFANEIYEAVAPTVVRGGTLTIVSTPRGQTGRFAELWREASRSANEYARLRIHWTQCPVYNPAGWFHQTLAARRKEGERSSWYLANRSTYSDMEWQRQFECDFVASTDLFFNVPSLQRLEAKARKPVTVEGALRVYREPDKKRDYIIACDPGTGLAHGDYSVAVVLERETGEEAAMLRGRWPMAEFANRIWDLRQRGYEGIIVPERNNIGQALCERLMEIDPRNLYRDRDDHRIGWKTTLKSRPPMLMELQAALRLGDLQMHTPEFYREAEVFTTEGAPDGEHDDTVMATAIAWHIRKHMVTVRQERLPRRWTGTPPESRTGY